jgi:hypothetical protein
MALHAQAAHHGGSRNARHFLESRHSVKVPDSRLFGHVDCSECSMSALAILHESSRWPRLIVKTSSVRSFGANLLGDEQQRRLEGSCGLGVLQADGFTCRRKPIWKDVE